MDHTSCSHFLASHPFKRGEYDVQASRRDGEPARRLLRLGFDRDDEPGQRRIPVVSLPSDLDPYVRSLVASALVRAGAQHPGLCDEDLATMHREAEREHHVELFTDLNALTTGLLGHVVQSLGGAIARVVVSSSSIDILHEYQGRIGGKGLRSGDFLRRAEMARALRLLEEMRRDVPVHVHQLPPGANRYFARNSAGPVPPPKPDAAGDMAELDALTFISEDRQMIAAYWDYMARANTRIPVRLITSDFALSHVCVAERVPLLFARSPYEVWRDPAAPADEGPRALWLDPFALALRFATPHAILWELCTVFERLTVAPGSSTEDVPFSLFYDPRSHLPGSSMALRTEPATPETAAEAPAKPPKTAPLTGGKPKLTKAPASTGHRKPEAIGSARSETSSLTLRLPLVLDVLPAKPGADVPLTAFKGNDRSALRQLEQIGEETGLYRVVASQIEAGAALVDLLRSLEVGLYSDVNAIFRKVRVYDDALREAEAEGVFRYAKSSGAATGWAVVLGAAYKTKVGALYGLAEVSGSALADAVASAHEELGEGQRTVPLPLILDHVCRSLHYSPIRFERGLDAILQDGTLRGYEPQRATVDVDLPEHDVLVAPKHAEQGHFLRHLTPGKGIRLGDTLVSSLVRRSGDA